MSYSPLLSARSIYAFQGLLPKSAPRNTTTASRPQAFFASHTLPFFLNEAIRKDLATYGLSPQTCAALEKLVSKGLRDLLTLSASTTVLHPPTGTITYQDPEVIITKTFNAGVETEEKYTQQSGPSGKNSFESYSKITYYNPEKTFYTGQTLSQSDNRQQKGKRQDSNISAYGLPLSDPYRMNLEAFQTLDIPNQETSLPLKNITLIITLIPQTPQKPAFKLILDHFKRQGQHLSYAYAGSRFQLPTVEEEDTLRSLASKFSLEPSGRL